AERENVLLAAAGAGRAHPPLHALDVVVAVADLEVHPVALDGRQQDRRVGAAADPAPRHRAGPAPRLTGARAALRGLHRFLLHSLIAPTPASPQLSASGALAIVHLRPPAD